MSAYNLVNGVYASEHNQLLQDILRDKWGFTGFVVSDWGGVNDRVESLRAGTDLEMPGSGEYNRKRIIEAVENGTLSTARLDESVVKLLAIILKAKDCHKENASRNPSANNHSQVSRKRCIYRISLTEPGSTLSRQTAESSSEQRVTGLEWFLFQIMRSPSV